MWVTIPLHLVTDKINAIGVVGMLVRCLSNAQSTLVHEPTYAKLIAKQSVLEKQVGDLSAYGSGPFHRPLTVHRMCLVVCL